MSENFYVNTVGAVPAGKLSEAVSLGVTLAEESKAAGSTRASVGTIMTGNNAGSVVFQQFFQSLNDFANVMDAFATSGHLRQNNGNWINSHDAKYSKILRRTF